MTTPETVSLPASEFDAGEMYFLLRDSIIPRPIAWVSTINRDGISNIAPFSFFNVCSPSPPVLGFSCGPRGDNHNDPVRAPKDTLLNIRDNGEFVVNLSPESLFDEMVNSSASLPHGHSEFSYTGLQEAPASVVKPPRVAHTPMAFECKLYDIVDLGVNHWIMGSIVHIHIAKNVYEGTREGKRHRVDLLKDRATGPMGRLGRAFYVRLREIEARLRRDGPN